MRRSTGSRYLTELVTSRCGVDLLAANVFPNAKEVTESFAAYSAARRHLKEDFPLGDPDVTCICVGDGSRPRTALTFALRSRWNCISVDPKMKVFNIRVSNRSAVDRLSCHRSRIEDMRITAKKAVIVAVHSHAGLAESIAAVTADRIAVIAIPCCVPLQLGRGPDVEYRDDGILSPENLVKVWRQFRRMCRVTDNLYVIQLDHGVWLTNWSRIPWQTLYIEDARRFDYADAHVHLVCAQKFYPNAKIVEVES